MPNISDSEEKMLKRWGWYCAGATGGLMMNMSFMLGNLTGKPYQGYIAGISIIIIVYFLWMLFDDYFTEKPAEKEIIKKD